MTVPLLAVIFFGGHPLAPVDVPGGRRWSGELFARPGLGDSPAGLLRGDAAVFRFRGRSRHELLDELAGWCTDAQPFGVRLVTGAGGQASWARIALTATACLVLSSAVNVRSASWPGLRRSVTARRDPAHSTNAAMVWRRPRGG